MEVHAASSLTRFLNFWKKPWNQKKQSLAFRYLRLFPRAFFPTRLPVGAWWFAENDFIGAAVLWNGFENLEYTLVGHLIRSGSTVLDIGAHKGFYSLLFSRRVGPLGRVLAFEPSKRERLRLKLHLKLNSCRNVDVFDAALGETEGKATLYVVEGVETGMNSLKPVGGDHAFHGENVIVRRLDSVLDSLGVDRVDFVKIDVEGGELGVLRGACGLLDRRPRPFVLAEISDLRTKSWGYDASEILRFMESKQFHWFSLRQEGMLTPLDRDSLSHEVNFLSVPEERLGEVNDRIVNDGLESTRSKLKQ